MKDSTPTQLRFPAIVGFSVRADFNGETLSSDFGAQLLQGVDRQSNRANRALASAIQDKRHPSYAEHSLHKWVKAIKPSKSDEQASELNHAKKEILKLRAQLRRTDEKRDILQKAARYFASQPE